MSESVSLVNKSSEACLYDCCLFKVQQDFVKKKKDLEAKYEEQLVRSHFFKSLCSCSENNSNIKKGLRANSFAERKILTLISPKRRKMFKGLIKVEYWFHFNCEYEFNFESEFKFEFSSLNLSLNLCSKFLFESESEFVFQCLHTSE